MILLYGFSLYMLHMLLFMFFPPIDSYTGLKMAKGQDGTGKMETDEIDT